MSTINMVFSNDDKILIKNKLLDCYGNTRQR